MTTMVSRCAMCAGPLPSSDEKVLTCEYCGCENKLVSDLSGQTERFAQAVTEAENMQAEVDAKTQLLQEKVEQAILSGDKQAALIYQEGVLRMAYAPTIHMYKSFDPNDPQVAAALTQIDGAIDAGLRATAEAWGVEYVPIAERT
jgi:hypothetical protein